MAKPATQPQLATAPNGLTVTGQPLTPYHSRLYSLLSWERPRNTAISYATVVVTILAARYLPLLRWGLKFLYLSLGLAATMEVVGRAVFSRGITTDARPRKYYTIPKDSIEGVLEDLEQLVDFFLIEFQRILFVENLTYTIAAFFASLVTYTLVRFLPLWGLALLGATVAYIGPLVYMDNKAVIDEQIDAIQEIINAQTIHVKEMAETRTAHASEVVRNYVNDYRAKAHEYVVTRSRQASPEMEKTKVEDLHTEKAEEASQLQPEVERPAVAEVQQADFPATPQTDLPDATVQALAESRKETVHTPEIAV